MRTTFIVLGIAVCLLSCKVKQADSSEVSGKETVQKAYNYTVAFGSPGSGIETEVYKEYKAFLSDYKPTLEYKDSQYGREGERDICLNLAGLKKDEVDAFKEASLKITSKGKYIQVFEDGRCR